ncbi:MAG TPA: response regulator [Rhizomicrobium sp.]
MLIVEDEFLIRMGAVDIARRAGHETLEAANADEAIRILESRNDIEIVLSDVQMPGTMDGVRLLQVIRDRWPPIRLILTSGKVLTEVANLPKGSVFLPKPYNYEELSEAFAKAA